LEVGDTKLKVFVVELRTKDLTQVEQVCLCEKKAKEYIKRVCRETGMDESNYKIYEFELPPCEKLRIPDNYADYTDDVFYRVKLIITLQMLVKTVQDLTKEIREIQQSIKIIERWIKWKQTQ